METLTNKCSTPEEVQDLARSGRIVVGLRGSWRDLIFSGLARGTKKALIYCLHYSYVFRFTKVLTCFFLLVLEFAF